MSRGRKPIPAAVRRLKGNPSRRRIQERLALPSAMPQPPWKLRKAALAQWDRLLAVLAPTGILTAIDADAVALWAETLAQYQEANEVLAKMGPIIDGPRGHPAANPILTVIRHHLAVMHRFQADFGCTPSARMRVGAPEAPKALDPFEEFLSQGAAKP